MRKKEEDLANNRNKTGAPLPEAAFARQRAAAIEAVVRAEPKAQSEVRLRHELAAVATAVAVEALAASAGAGEKVRKRAADKATSFREAEMQAKKARTKIINKINVCVAIGSSFWHKGGLSPQCKVSCGAYPFGEPHGWLSPSRSCSIGPRSLRSFGRVRAC